MYQRNLAISIGFNGQQAMSGLDQTDQKVNNLKQSAVNLGRRFENTGRKMQQVGRTLATRVTLPLIGIAGASVKAASDFEELESKFNVVFGSMADDTREWAEETAESIGRSRAAIMGYLADSQNMMVGMGATREEGQELSKQLVTLSTDLASFNNMAEDDALQRLQSVMIGNHTAAAGLGAVVNENTLALAMERMQLEGKFQDLSELEKMQVRYTAVVMQSEDAIGDAERTSGSFANQVRALRGDLHDMAVEIGQILMPHAQDLIQWARAGIDIFKDLDKDTQANIVRFGMLAAAVAPVLIVGSMLISSIGKIMTTFGGLALKLGGGTLAFKALTLGALAFVAKAGLVIGAVVAIGYFISRVIVHWDTITEAIDRAGEAIRNFIETAREFFRLPDFTFGGSMGGGHGGISGDIRAIQQMDTGGHIRKGSEGVAMLHENEVVVRSPLVQAMERFFSTHQSDRQAMQGGSGAVINYNPNITVDARGATQGAEAGIRKAVQQVLDDHYRQNFSRLATNTLR